MATADVSKLFELNNDLLIKIIFGLHVKDWGRFACVSKKSYSILHDFCYKIICNQTHPTLVTDLLSVSSSPPGGWAALFKLLFCCPGLAHVGVHVEAASHDEYVLPGPHLASERLWLSCEHGNKMLDNRFRRNCLYLSNWPNCEHINTGQYSVIYRGIFINFKETVIWWEINNAGDKYKVDLKCAFCSCKNIWDLYSSFSFEEGFVLKIDGVLVDRAFICENGHVFGIWTIDLGFYMSDFYFFNM